MRSKRLVSTEYAIRKRGTDEFLGEGGRWTTFADRWTYETRSRAVGARISYGFTKIAEIQTVRAATLSTKTKASKKRTK